MMCTCQYMVNPSYPKKTRRHFLTLLLVHGLIGNHIKATEVAEPWHQHKPDIHSHLWHQTTNTYQQYG
mgnify:CR=1 FL=1